MLGDNHEGHIYLTAGMEANDVSRQTAAMTLTVNWRCYWHAKFFRGNKNIYLLFMLFLLIDTIQMIEILPQVR